MPERKRPGLKGVYIEFEEGFLAQVQDLARANNRPFKEEVMHALHRHLAAPPVFVMTTPAMPPAMIECARATANRSACQAGAVGGEGEETAEAAEQVRGGFPCTCPAPPR